jgi:hypothetical protein
LTAALALFLAGAAVNLTAALDSAAVAGSPAPTFTPPAPPVPDGTPDAVPLVVAAWEAVAGGADAVAAGDRDRWLALADTLAVQWRVLTGPDPAARSDPGVEAAGEPGTPSSFGSAQEAVNAAREALSVLGEFEWAQAEAAAGLDAAWWAGLAGSADQLRYGLTGAYTAPPPLKPLTTLAVSADADAAATLAAAYHEAVYTASALQGRTSGTLRSTITAALDQFRRGRDTLQALAGEQGWTLPAAAAAYPLPALETEADCLAALGASVRAVSQAAAAWLGSTSAFHAEALADVRSAAGLGSGYASQIWFGWPD